MTGRLPRIQNAPKEDLSDSEPTAAPTSHETRRRRVILIVGAIIAVAAVGIGARYYLWALHHESTDDAFIDGHIVHVAPQVGGRVSEVLVTDNQPVRVGDLLVKIDPADLRAKLDQNPEVSQILLSTGNLILLPDHVQEKDPPAEWLYNKIWMEIRSELQHN